MYNLLANGAAEQSSEKYKFKMKTISEYKHFIKSKAAPDDLTAMAKPFSIHKPQAAPTKNWSIPEMTMANTLFLALRGGRGNESGYVRQEFLMLWDFASRMCACIFIKDDKMLLQRWDYLNRKEKEAKIEKETKIKETAKAKTHMSIDVSMEEEEEVAHNVRIFSVLYSYGIYTHIYTYSHIYIHILIHTCTHHIHTQMLPTSAIVETVDTAVVHVPVQMEPKKKRHDWTTPEAQSYLKQIDVFTRGTKQSPHAQDNLSFAKSLNAEYFQQIEKGALRKALKRYRTEASAPAAPPAAAMCAPVPVASSIAGASAASSSAPPQQGSRGKKRSIATAGGGAAKQSALAEDNARKLAKKGCLPCTSGGKRCDGKRLGCLRVQGQTRLWGSN